MIAASTRDTGGAAFLGSIRIEPGSGKGTLVGETIRYDLRPGYDTRAICRLRLKRVGPAASAPLGCPE